jgi:hypothetical protein
MLGSFIMHIYSMMMYETRGHSHMFVACHVPWYVSNKALMESNGRNINPIHDDQIQMNV